MRFGSWRGLGALGLPGAPRAPAVLDRGPLSASVVIIVTSTSASTIISIISIVN